MRRLAIFWLWFTGALATGSSDSSGSLYYISDLEGDSSPRFLALTATMNGDESASDIEFGNVWILANEGCPKYRLVEVGSSFRILSPDGIFDFLDVEHGKLTVIRLEKGGVNEFEIQISRWHGCGGRLVRENLISRCFAGFAPAR